MRMSIEDKDLEMAVGGTVRADKKEEIKRPEYVGAKKAGGLHVMPCIVLFPHITIDR